MTSDFYEVRKAHARQPHETDRWLACLLIDRQTVDSTAVQRAAIAEGLNWRTVQRAADRLGVSRRRLGFGPGSRVQWSIGDSIGINVIRSVAAEGITVRIQDGVLRASGPTEALGRWRAALMGLGAELRQALEGTTSSDATALSTQTGRRDPDRAKETRRTGQRRAINWLAIEHDYRIGQLSIRMMATKHRVAPSSITRRAKRRRWRRRDLAGFVRKLTFALVDRDVARGQLIRDNSMPTGSWCQIEKRPEVAVSPVATRPATSSDVLNRIDDGDKCTRVWRHFVAGIFARRRLRSAPPTWSVSSPAR